MSADDIKARIKKLLDTRPQPVAFGVGLASVGPDGTKVLDSAYPSVNLGENAGFAAIVADVAGHAAPSGTFELTQSIVDEVLDVTAPLRADGGSHPNAEVLEILGQALSAPSAPTGVTRVPIVTFIESLDASPLGPEDVYLRLHLLSTRRVAPHGLSLEGAFGHLNNVVWTSEGPCDPEGFERVRLELAARGRRIIVTSLDKFPRMTDYVIPSGVRIGDADRVRLGAHLAEGTTVMHEGFVNFNAGTLGTAMIEGRISAGVVIGDGTDLGGSASVMGTLSGGGKEVISVGEGCLLGANSGLGISLGAGCIVEAGLYITSGTLVQMPDGSVTKARELSGADGMLFRRNSQTGAVEVLARGGSWGEGLNAELHAND